MKPLSKRYKIFAVAWIINTLSAAGLGIFSVTGHLLPEYLCLIPLILSTMAAVLALEPIWEEPGS